MNEPVSGEASLPARIEEELPKDLVLAQGERVASVLTLMASTVWFFLKAKITLTDRRLVAKRPSLLWDIIPVGSDAVTFPLQSISGVRVLTRFSWKAFALGLVMALFFRKLGLLVGIGLMAGAFATEIAVTNAGGQTATFLVSIFESGKARQMVDRLNLMLANRFAGPG